MDIRRKLHFGSQSDASAWQRGSVRLLGGETEVRRLNCVCYLVAQLGKKLADYVVPGKSLPVLGFKEFFPNDALGINEEISGSGHALVLSGRFGIQNVISTNRLRIRVGEHRKFDIAAVSEGLQYLHAVIADRGHFNSLLFKSRFCVLQLDQLPFAV